MRIIESRKGSQISYKFYYMPSGEHKLALPRIEICYCPFCGVNLFDFYVKRRDVKEYINRIDNDATL